MEIFWEEPPSPQTGHKNKGIRRSQYWEILDQLETRPGQWACVEKNSSRSVSPIYSIIRNHELPFEVVVRKNKDGSYSHYARRVSEEEQVQAKQEV
jgi:hypothetical protein